MIRFLLRRLLNYLVLLVLASFLAFCLASVTFHPLDSFIERHPQPPAEAIHAKAVELGLDKPVPIRYAEWAAGVVRGNFGTTVTGHPVTQELWSRVGVSLRLVLIGSLVGTVAGVVLGAWGAVRQYRLSDRVITVVSLIVLSIPSFVLAGLLILAALRVNNLAGVRIFAYTGETSPIPPGAVWDQFVDRARHIALPSLTLALGAAASFSRYQRNAMLDVLSEDFIRTARAKGLMERIVVNRHGRRFYDEGEDLWPKRYAIWGRLIAQQPDLGGSIILQSRIASALIAAAAQGIVDPALLARSAIERCSSMPSTQFG